MFKNIGLIAFLIKISPILLINPLDGGRVIKSIAFSLNSNFGIGNYRCRIFSLYL